MDTQKKTALTVETSVKAPVSKVWEFWNKPEHITKWATASDEWHTPRAENDLRVGGKFNNRMEAKDGSMGFDFGGVYDVVTANEYIEYSLSDGRKVIVIFKSDGDQTTITETFDAETQNSLEMQQAGWQAILNNFKAYVESN